MTQGKIFYTFIISFALYFSVSGDLLAQRMDLDSLLQKTVESIRQENYSQAIKQAQMGIQRSPEYLDFHLFLGRAYQMTHQKDSARFYLKHVIEKNPEYEASYQYLLGLEIEEKNYDTALILADKAITHHPDNITFRLRKWNIYQLQGNEKKEYEYLSELVETYPNNAEIRQRLFLLESKNKSDRLGLNYTVTFIDRDPVGPWHLGSVQYIRERSWGSFIGRVSYANRFSGGESIVDGLQFEAESYFFMGPKDYSYVGASFSGDDAFPDLRLNYSYFHNFSKGWESELGIRYTKVPDNSFTGAVVGVGKYVGSYWLNLRSFFLEEDKKWYPAVTLTTRYYIDTRFDYATLIVGYGSSPDERSIQGLIGQRLSLDSYRFGAGYYRMLGDHYLAGLQFMYNNQEYIAGENQNEYEVYLSLQYKF